MKTKELIRQLVEVDPDGECEVFCPDGDIWFVQRLPWYYDGRPGILHRDPELTGKSFDLTGMRQITEKDGDKIYVYTMDVDDLMCDGWNDMIVEGDEQFVKNAEERRAYWKAYSKSLAIEKTV